MISKQYIHENDILDSWLYESFHIMNDIHDCENRILAMECELGEKQFFKEDTSDFIAYMESEKKGIFEKIGKKIIELTESFLEATRKILEKIRTALFGVKKMTTDEKYLKMMENDPEFAKKFKESVLNGSIDLKDFKDINTLIDEADKISKEFLSGKMDVKNYEKIMDDKLDKYANRAKNITAILALAGSAATVYKAYKTLNDNTEEAIKCRQRLGTMRDNAKRAAELSAMNDGVSDNRLAAYARYHKELMNITARNTSALGKLTDKFYGFIIKHNSKEMVGTSKTVNTDFTYNDNKTDQEEFGTTKNRSFTYGKSGNR